MVRSKTLKDFNQSKTSFKKNSKQQWGDLGEPQEAILIFYCSWTRALRMPMAEHTLFDSEDAAGKLVAFHVTLEQKVPAGYLWDDSDASHTGNSIQHRPSWRVPGIYLTSEWHTKVSLPRADGYN